MKPEADYVDLSKVQFTAELLKCIPKHLAFKYRVLPISISTDSLWTAIVDPSDMDAIDSLTHILKRPILCRGLQEEQFDTFYARLYAHPDAESERRWDAGKIGASEQ
jgi:hypothetical protein